MADQCKKRGALAQRHAPVPAQQDGRFAKPFINGQPAAAKRPVVRKCVEAFYFAAKAYALLHGSHALQDLRATVPASHEWKTPDQGMARPMPEGRAAAHQPKAGLLTVWYPEVRTLVVAYAGGKFLEDKVATATDDWATPFYLPESWEARARQPYAAAFNSLHAGTKDSQQALEAGHAGLDNFTGGELPSRILVTGYSTGGALAEIAAPWLALAYPSADTRLVTFGSPFVASPNLSRLAEWSVGIRLGAVLEHDPSLKHQKSHAKAGLERSPVSLPAKGGGAHTLADYTLSLASFFESAELVETTGSGIAVKQYALGSFWGRSDYAIQLWDAAKRLSAPDGDAEQTALEYAARYNVSGTAVAAADARPATPLHAASATSAGKVATPPKASNGPGPDTPPQKVPPPAERAARSRAAAPAPNKAPGFVALSAVEDAAASLVPGPAGVRTLDETLQRLAALSIVQPALYSQSAYACEVVPNEFAAMSKFPLCSGGEHGCPNVQLVSDPLSTATAYVCWDEPTGTALLAFRGTTPYNIDSILSDLEFFQFKAQLTVPPKPKSQPQGLWGRIKAIPGQLHSGAVEIVSGAYVHRGFLGQFQALAGVKDDFELGDLLSPLSGPLRAWRTLLRALLPSNNGPLPKDIQRNIASVLGEMTGGRAPLRVLCTGHSLGGALATIASEWAALTFPDSDVRCITFGSPRVGNKAFVQEWREVVGTRIRAVHANDIVPSVPFSYVGPIPTGFTHVYPAVWLRPHGPALELEDVEFKRPLLNPLDESRIWTVLLPRNIEDHMMYKGYRGTLNRILGSMGLPERMVLQNEDSQLPLT